MKQIVLFIAAVYGLSSVILGAFGAHAFKKLLTDEKLASFEVGVKYQMYHALAILAVGLYFQMNSGLEKTIVWSWIAGTFIFSVSIYLLSFADYWGVNLRWLGPITPFGGLFMMIGWATLCWYFLKVKTA